MSVASVEPVDGLCEGVIVAVADGGLYARLCQALSVQMNIALTTPSNR
jgi:hypothetical protein